MLGFIKQYVFRRGYHAMFKIWFLALVLTFAFIQLGCQGNQPPEIDKEEAHQELEVDRETLEPIAEMHQDMNSAVGWDSLPSEPDIKKVFNYQVPNLKELKEEIDHPKLEKDLERLLDYLIKGGEIARAGNRQAREEAREYWVKAHRIAHDLDWKLLGNRPSDGSYWGYSKYLESKQ